MGSIQKLQTKYLNSKTSKTQMRQQAKKIWVSRTTHLSSTMKRRGSHQANDGRAIRVSNESTLSRPNSDPLHSIRIHLRNHQRHILIHPKSRAIVDHNSPFVHSNGSELFADGTSSTEEGYINAIEAFFVELFDGVVVALEGVLLTGRAFRGEHFDGAIREVTVRENREELLAYSACDTYYGYGGCCFLKGHADGGGSNDGSGFGVGFEELEMIGGEE